jgi:hypothetical protein
MTFDAPKEFQISTYELHEIMKDLGLHISVKRKTTLGYSILIKTQERNASAIYAARFQLLKAKDLDQFVMATIPESYKFQPNPWDLNREEVFNLSSDSGVEDTHSPILSPTNPNFYPAPLDNFASHCLICGSNIDGSYAEQHCNSLCQMRLVNMENYFKSSRTNRLPVFIDVTSKFNKVTC